MSHSTPYDGASWHHVVSTVHALHLHLLRSVVQPFPPDPKMMLPQLAKQHGIRGQCAKATDMHTIAGLIVPLSLPRCTGTAYKAQVKSMTHHMQMQDAWLLYQQRAQPCNVAWVSTKRCMLQYKPVKLSLPCVSSRKATCHTHNNNN